MLFSIALSTLLAVCQAAPGPESRGLFDPTVTIASPRATIVGSAGTVEKFLGIPFAQPPVRNLRLKPPQPITQSLGTVQATQNGNACPQQFFDTSGIPSFLSAAIADNPVLHPASGPAAEDCLNINIFRPAGTKAGAKLPVLFWIFGGGFEFGSNGMYDGSGFVQKSVLLGQPIIFVAANYRVGGFGFLAGKEILADGSANLGLLDQRLGLKWTADNIRAFGGDPDKVTIWGESAGSISVFDHLIAYNGDNKYKGKPLFRAAIMNSGSVIPADPVDSVKGQAVYDAVVKRAGCSGKSDTLACLRSISFGKFSDAVNSVPAITSYNSLSLSYLPRPDGKFLTESPDKLGLEGKFARVPTIIGDQEDEGTLFALFQSNITTKAQVVDYLKDIFFLDITREQLVELVNLYDPQSYGSPFRTSDVGNNFYPQFKRLAAILGDLTFTLSRRATLQAARQIAPDLPYWSYLNSYGYGTPVLGTFHATDLISLFFNPVPSFPQSTMQAYYISFVNTMDPNKSPQPLLRNWPEWKNDTRLLLNTASDSSKIIKDDFRDDAFHFILTNKAGFYIKR